MGSTPGSASFIFLFCATRVRVNPNPRLPVLPHSPFWFVPPHFPFLFCATRPGVAAGDAASIPHGQLLPTRSWALLTVLFCRIPLSIPHGELSLTLSWALLPVLPHSPFWFAPPHSHFCFVPPGPAWQLATLLRYRMVNHYKSATFLGPRIGDKVMFGFLILTLYWDIGSKVHLSIYVSKEQAFLQRFARCSKLKKDCSIRIPHPHTLLGHWIQGKSIYLYLYLKNRPIRTLYWDIGSKVYLYIYISIYI